MRPGVAAALLCAALIVLSTGRVHAQTTGTVVRVPLTIDYLTLTEALKHELYVEPGVHANLWNGINRCQYLIAGHPRFSRATASQIKFDTNARLSFGVPIGETCVTPISWKGIIEATATPYVAPGMMLRLHVTNINLYNDQHEKTLIAGHGFDLIKHNIIPRLQGFGFDLNPATRQLVSLAQDAAPPDVAERVRKALATLRAEPKIGVNAEGVRPTLAITLPFTASAAATVTPTPAPLTPAQVAAFEKILDQWDAFMVFAIKQLGATSHDPILREQLFNLLLDSRYQLIQAVENPTSGGPDPVRILFLKDWRRLGTIIRAAASRGTLGNRSLEFLSFISSGDALFALDKAAPALGIRISAADLRRLARIMAPGVKANPLAFSYREDPELRKMFGFNVAPLRETPSPGAATPSPAASPTAVVTSTATPTSTATVTPSTTPTTAPTATARPTQAAASPQPSPRPTSTMSPNVSPAASSAPTPVPGAAASPHASPTAASTSWLDLPGDLLAPTSACAAESKKPHGSDGGLPGELRTLGNQLRRAVVSDHNAAAYHRRMADLLRLSAERTVRDDRAAARHRAMYGRLMKSVAWQESCWRQFVRKDGRVRWLESSTGDIGLMQVNKRVWRGFYNIRLLEWDVVYNAGAGSEILAHLLADIAASRRINSKDPGALARSTYAAYNGGPSAYLRWLGREPRSERLIDRSFWRKYQAISRGQTIDILSCAAQWGKAPGH